MGFLWWPRHGWLTEMGWSGELRLGDGLGSGPVHVVVGWGMNGGNVLLLDGRLWCTQQG